MPGDKFDNLNLVNLIDYENNTSLTTFTNCFNESLRMQPPVYYSSTCRTSETIQCGDFKIRKGDPFTISMFSLCNNPNEWIEPERFIPERFDEDSEYFLTPSGNRRNPYSFSPFLGGNRICIGKTFIEVISKITVPTLLAKFKFEFEEGVDPDKYEMPHNNMTCSFAPTLKVRISKEPHVFTYES